MITVTKMHTGRGDGGKKGTKYDPPHPMENFLENCYLKSVKYMMGLSDLLT
jgi:hypothetical protein